MGLVTLLTNPKKFKFYTGKGYSGDGNTTGQKSLRYGNDRLGGADSGQPYIQVGIPDNVSQLVGNSDFLTRGLSGIITTVDRAETDVKRLYKMFTDTKSPNGILFTAKQELLSRTAVRTQSSYGLLNEGIYNPLNTLAQAGVVAFGGHLPKQGLTPFQNELRQKNYGLEDGYYFAAKEKYDGDEKYNRLVTIYNDTNLINKNQQAYTTINFGGVSGTTINPGGLLAKNNPVIMNYRGGPGSYLGIGKTNIYFSPESRTGYNNDYYTTNKEWFFGRSTGNTWQFSELNPYWDKTTNSNLSNSGYLTQQGKYFYSVYDKNTFDVDFVSGSVNANNTPLINSNNTFTYNQNDLNTPYGSPTNNPAKGIQDFRAILRATLSGTQQTDAINSGATPYSLDYVKDNIENRVNLGNPGNKTNKSYAFYNKGVLDKSTNKSIYPNISISNLGTAISGLDRITSIPIYRSENVTNDSTVNDLVKFRIDIIDNDEPKWKTFIHFRAFLDTISDNFSAQWNPIQYLGRGDSFYNYGGFSRSLSLGWTVAAQSKQELIAMYKKLNYLASSLAPDYSGNGYMRGNLARLTIGGYLYEMPGVITSFTYDISETPWEIGVGTNFNTGGKTIQGDPSVKELPHIIKITSFNFTPIPNFLPQIQQNNWSIDAKGGVKNQGFPSTYGSERFISLKNSSSPNTNQAIINAMAGNPTGGSDNYDIPDADEQFFYQNNQQPTTQSSQLPTFQPAPSLNTSKNTQLNYTPPPLGQYSLPYDWSWGP